MSITKVAKLAGVSSSTVSRVINNHPRVAPMTIESVRKAMRELNYTPSDRRPGPKPMSRLRATPATVDFLVLGTSSGQGTPGFADLLRGVSMGASQNGLDLIFSHIPDPDKLPLRLMEERVDGVLLHGAMPGLEARRYLERLPTVWLMGNRHRPTWGDQVMPDVYEVGDLAARYLIARGHQRLAFLNMDAAHWVFRVGAQSFAAAAQAAGVPVNILEILPPMAGDYWLKYRPETIEQLVRQFLTLDPRPTGLFIADDMQTALLQPALQSQGVEMGLDERTEGRIEGGSRTEIISCNNERPYLVGLNPKPTTIDTRIESIGRRGIEQLLWRLEHPEVRERIISTVEPAIVPAENGAFALSRP